LRRCGRPSGPLKPRGSAGDCGSGGIGSLLRGPWKPLAPFGPPKPLLGPPKPLLGPPKPLLAGSKPFDGAPVRSDQAGTERLPCPLP
jgi:hypothetical protein